MPETMTPLDLDALAEQALLRAEQQEEEQRQRKEAAQARREQEACDALLAQLQQLIPDLLPALQVTCVVERQNTSLQPTARLRYRDAIWYVSLRTHDGWSEQPPTWTWYVRSHNGRLSNDFLAQGIAPTQLREELLTSFGLYRAAACEQAEKQAEQERRQRQREAERLAQKAQYEAEQLAQRERKQRERQERLAQAKAEDTHWRDEIARLRREREATLWRWPADTAITFYHLTYTTAIGRDEEGASLHQQEAGWTRTDQLDEASYIRLEATKPSFWREVTRPRDLKLDREHHLPVWERFSAASVEELPEVLREEITVSFPHVVEVYGYDSVESDEGVCLLNEVNHPGDFESGPYAESIGWVPLPWIRELVEQTREVAHQEMDEPSHPLAGYQPALT